METKEKIPVIEKEKNAVKEKHTGKNGRKKKHITSFIEPNLKTILIALFALVACIILLTTSWKGDRED